MKKRIATVLISVALILSIRITQIHAATPDLYIYSQSQGIVFANVYSSPFSINNLPIETLVGKYDPHTQKIIVHTSTILPNTYLLVYQPIDSSSTYTPLDSSFFIYTQDIPETVFELVATRLENISFDAKEVDKQISITISSTDSSINFLKYPSNLLYITLINNGQSISMPASTLLTCNNIFCGTVMGEFNTTIPEGKYDIAVQYGKEDLLYINDAIDIIHPTPNIPLPTGGIPTTVTPSMSQSFKQVIIQPIKDIKQSNIQSIPSVNPKEQVIGESTKRQIVVPVKKTQSNNLLGLIDWVLRTISGVLNIIPHFLNEIIKKYLKVLI